VPPSSEAPPATWSTTRAATLTPRLCRPAAYSVLLFDEIEKAHPYVFNVLCSSSRTAVSPTAQGRTVDFRNTVCHMTSTSGATSSVRRRTRRGRAGSSRILSAQQALRPEFLNSDRQTVIFQSARPERDASIVEIQARYLVKWRPGRRERIAPWKADPGGRGSCLLARARPGGNWGARSRRPSTHDPDPLAPQLPQRAPSRADSGRVAPRETRSPSAIAEPAWPAPQAAGQDRGDARGTCRRRQTA